MSIFTSLFTGSSGVAAHGAAISVVGDNIANVSTFGFKSSRAGFADVLGGQIGRSRLGAGVVVDGTQTQFGQGSLQQTGGVLDLAIRGRGFFVLGGTHDGQAGQYFSRDGRFALDDEGNVVNPQGLRLQGYPIDSAGVQSVQLGDLAFGGRQTPPAATTAAAMSVNLDSTEPAAPAWDPLDPATTSSYATSVTVYDSLGAAHRSDVYFASNGAGGWAWHAMVDGGELTGGTAGVPTEIASGNLTFTPTGALDTETMTFSSADFLGATPGQAIAFDFGDAITTDGGTGLTGTTQFAGPSSVASLDVDGFGFGTLVDLAVSDDGTVEGVFSNGQRRAIARVALANFTSEDGLARGGDSLFTETVNSGEPLIDAAATGGRGAISGGALEASNVDLSDQLVTMIAYQRAFQANVRTVTTADEMLAEIANIKR
jgi:flagellar hook protein FlgE